MFNSDEQSASILARYGVPAENGIWHVQGQAFVHHWALEHIAAQAGITFDPPTVIRAKRDEAVLVVAGRMGERAEWPTGEALLDVNYHVPEPEAAYVYAMAEKRAKDRVILKLIGLPDLLSSEEPHAVESHPLSSNENTPAVERDQDRDMVGELKRKLDSAQTADAVITLMRADETQRRLQRLAPGLTDEVRAYAKARLVALGWTPNKAA